MSATVAGAHPTRGSAARWLTGLGLALVWFVVTLLSLWAMAAVYIDVRWSALRLPLTILYAVILVVILAKYKLRIRSALLCFASHSCGCRLASK